MSTLKNILRGQGNTLQSVTEEEARTRTTTPVGGALEGQSPDQAKMQGTPNQLKGLVQQAQPQYAQTLQREQRVGAAAMPRTERNEAEERAYGKSEYLKSLGHLGDRVTTLINSEVSKLVAPSSLQAKTQKDIEGLGFSLADGYTYDQLKQGLEGFASQALPSIVNENGQLADPGTIAQVVEAFASANPNALVEINKALGKSPTAPLTIDELKSLYAGVNETMVASIASQMPDKVLVTDELAVSMGYPGGTAEVAELLGKTQAEILGMNVLQLDEAAEDLKAKEFGRVEEIRARLNSPSISSAERQALRQELRALGASGVRATEASVAKTIEKIESGETIKFGDKEYKLSELLDDEEISGVIKDYMENPDGELGKTLPQGLKDFIENNRDVLEDAIDELDDDVAEFAKTQKENLEIGTIDGGAEGAAQINDKVLEQVFGEGWKDQFRGENILETAGPWPLLRTLHEDGAWENDEKVQIVSNLNRLAETEPELAKEILRMTPQQIQELGLNMKDNTRWTSFVEQRKIARKLDRLGPNASLDSILDTVFGKNIDTKALQAAAQDLEYAKRLGIELPEGAKDLLKWMQPGKLLEQIKKTGSLSDLMEYKNSLINLNVDLDSIGMGIKPQLKKDSLWKIWNYTKDGKIDGKNVREFAPHLSYDELKRVLKSPALTPSGKWEIEQHLTKTVQGRMLKEASTFGIDTYLDSIYPPTMDKQYTEYSKGLLSGAAGDEIKAALDRRLSKGPISIQEMNEIQSYWNKKYGVPGTGAKYVYKYLQAAQYRKGLTSPAYTIAMMPESQRIGFTKKLDPLVKKFGKDMVYKYYGLKK